MKSGPSLSGEFKEMTFSTLKLSSNFQNHQKKMAVNN